MTISWTRMAETRAKGARTRSLRLKQRAPDSSRIPKTDAEMWSAASRPALLWICGAPGVGKSTAGWALFGQLTVRGTRTAFVDIDQLGMCMPAPEDDPDRVLLKARNLGAWVGTALAAGAERLVVSGVATAAEAETFSRHARGTRITWVLLRLGESELRCRLEATGWDDPMVGEALRYADEVAASSFADVTLDVAEMGPDDVTRWLLALAPKKPKGRAGGPTAVPAGESRHRPPVLWICGPLGSGKSTIGRMVFQRLLDKGIRALFLDLQQIGFYGPPDPADLENHRVKARNLGAIVSATSASAAVVTGRVETEDVVRMYSEQLPSGTVLALARLRANRDTLHEHLNLRARGGGWRETGDPLRGVPPERLEPLLDRAVAEQAALERSGLGHARIEVDGRAPEVIADEIIAAVPGWAAVLSGTR
jgi:adenylylsulfate kinase-like enzyme